MPAFCPPNISISDIWINHGVSQCFMDTVSSSVIAGFLLIFGMAQLIIYRRYSTGIDARRLRPSFLYKFQIFLMLLLTVLTGVRLDLRWKFYEGAEIFGFMVSSVEASSQSSDLHESSSRFSTQR
jgi:ATP-binding cassette, subfamily B (MDR/TAP), member 6